MKKIVSICILPLCALIMTAQEVDVTKLVFIKNQGFGHTYIDHEGKDIKYQMLPDIFSACPENAVILKKFKAARIIGNIGIYTGFTLVTGVSVFYLIANGIFKQDYDWKHFHSICFAGEVFAGAGLLSISIADRYLFTAHNNYNLYIMGIPLK